jgi:alpha-L-fucosidase 2
VREGNSDEGLCALLFHYGRYLLMASSRPGTEPANLQGIWNDQVRPPLELQLDDKYQYRNELLAG